MPRQKGKGGKNRKKAKNTNQTQKRELVYKEAGEEYAQILKMMGNGRFECYCFDGKKRQGIISGKMRKKVWMAAGDVILVSLRDFQDDKCDTLMKYFPEEVRQLQALEELPQTLKLNEGDEGQTGQNYAGNDDVNVQFEDFSGDEEEKEDLKNKKLRQSKMTDGRHKAEISSSSESDDEDEEDEDDDDDDDEKEEHKKDELDDI